LRKDIQAGRGSNFPSTTSLVQGLSDDWQREVEQAPGQTGIRLAAAMKSLKAAADAVKSAFDKEYAEDALAMLKTAESHLKKADAEFKLARAGD